MHPIQGNLQVGQFVQICLQGLLNMKRFGSLCFLCNFSSQFQVFEKGKEAWGPMALVAGRLIVRDMTRMTCLDVAKRE